MTLREEHRALTSRKILDAVLQLVAEGAIDQLSVPAVAERSGVSVPTIYRYYRTKDDLLAAAAAEPARRALANVAADLVAGADYATVQRALWAELATNLPLLRHQVVAEAGREMRTMRLESSRRQLTAHIERLGVDAESDEGRRLIAMLMLVSGSLALVELHDRQGLDVDEALHTSLWAAHVLIDATATAARRRSKHRGPR